MRASNLCRAGGARAALGLVVTFSTFSACGLDGGSCPSIDLTLKTGTYETGVSPIFNFPMASVATKSMTYDKQTGKVTITYSYDGKTYVETWMRRPMGR